jgi:hypothetical protein
MAVGANRMKTSTIDYPKPNKLEAVDCSYEICRIIDAFRSPAPDPRRSELNL